MVYRPIHDRAQGDIYTGTRVCRKCTERQSMTEFYWAKEDKLRARTCRTCSGNRQRERKTTNRDMYRQQGFVRTLRVKYGITFEQWELLLKQQNGLCPVCSKVLTRKNAHVDHDHSTGIVRGLLCFECNTGIGKFHDSVDWLLAAVNYLQSPPPDITHRSRELSPEERKQNRSMSIIKWYQSDAGKQATKERSQRFSGENGNYVKLTDEQCIEIIRRYRAGGVSQASLGREYGVNQSNISQLILGKTRGGLRAINLAKEDEES